MSDPNRIEPTLDDPIVARGAREGQQPEQPPSQGGPQAQAEAAQPEATRVANDAGALSEAQAQIAELQAKNKELAEQYLRAQADMQNTRRRAEDEMAKARKFAVESFAEAMLPVVDSLEAALTHKDATAEQVLEGSEATLKQLKSALERNKVVEINPPAGTKFDPHLHQAITMVPGTSQEPNTIVHVMQKGYLIADRILRPALVTVAAPR
jgi:molecular chaperone GrpE